MYQVKSIFNKVRAFPQYFDAADSLNLTLESERKMAEGMLSTFPSDISLFCESQPEEFVTVINEIQNSGKKQIETYQNLLSKLSLLPNEFAELYAIYNDISKEWASVTGARDAAAKSKAAAKKAKVYAKRFEGQESPEALKASAAREMAKKQASTDDQTAESLRDEKFKIITELKKKFMDTLAKALIGEADGRVKAGIELEQVSVQLLETIPHLNSYHDSTIPLLRKRLEQLQTETIE